MTLVLTFLSEQSIVQASDRRVTFPNRRVSDVMNKAVIIGTVGCAAYTGLAFLNGRVPTDETLMQSVHDSLHHGHNALERLAHDSSRAVRMNVGLRSEPDSKVVARTSMVLALFVQSDRGRVPTIHVVSNAQSDLTDAWLPEASSKFGLVSGGVRPRSFILHVAGQRLPNRLKVDLVRQIRRVRARCLEPEPVARLLARTIQEVSGTNLAVGANVNAVLVRNMPQPPPDPSGQSLLPPMGMPLGEYALREIEFFKSPRGGIEKVAVDSIFLPDPWNPQIAFGPSQVHPEVMIKGVVFGPVGLTEVMQKAVEDLHRGHPTDLSLPRRFRRPLPRRVLP